MGVKLIKRRSAIFLSMITYGIMLIGCNSLNNGNEDKAPGELPHIHLTTAPPKWRIGDSIQVKVRLEWNTPGVEMYAPQIGANWEIPWRGFDLMGSELQFPWKTDSTFLNTALKRKVFVAGYFTNLAEKSTYLAHEEYTIANYPDGYHAFTLDSHAYNIDTLPTAVKKENAPKIGQ